MIFYIAKHRLMSVFEKILRHALSTTSPPIQEFSDLETDLDNTYSSLPRILRPRTVDDAITDSSSLIITRLCVLFLYQKSRCVLHRKYAAQGRRESVVICYDASSSIIRYFLDIYNDLQPGGQLETERWFDSTLTWQDFLLGIMVLCLVLCVSSHGLNVPEIDSVLAAELLRRAQVICSNVSYKSENTTRVLKLISATLRRLGLSHDSNVQAPVYIDGHATSKHSGSTNGANDAVSTAAVDDLWYLGNTETIPSLDDPSWTYLEQYLNLPNDDMTWAL